MSGYISIRERYQIMIRGSICQEDIAILSIYVSHTEVKISAVKSGRTERSKNIHNQSHRLR